MKEKIGEIFKQLITGLQALSLREKCFFSVMILLLGGTGLYFVVGQIHSGLVSQATRLDQAQRDLHSLPFVLERYVKLTQRKKKIEGDYQKLQLKGDFDASSYLEGLFTEIAGISGISIQDPSRRMFGGHYEKASYAIRGIRVTNLKTFIEMLEKLVSGDKPFIIEEIMLSKSRHSSSLSVTLNVSTIRDVTSS